MKGEPILAEEGRHTPPSIRTTVFARLETHSPPGSTSECRDTKTVSFGARRRRISLRSLQRDNWRDSSCARNDTFCIRNVTFRVGTWSVKHSCRSCIDLGEGEESGLLRRHQHHPNVVVIT